MRPARAVERDPSRRALELTCRIFTGVSLVFDRPAIKVLMAGGGRKVGNWIRSFHARNNRRAMNLEPNDLVLFARVVDEGSFSRAAERVGLPKSTVSRRVAALEAQLGESLLQRTTRKLAVTDFGRAVLEHARHVAEDVAAAESLAQHRRQAPSGRLRVSMPGDLANGVLAPFLAAFAMRHPAVSLEVDLSARFVDVIGERFDLAIRMGDLRDDSTLAARRIATFTGGLYAAPSYLARRGSPGEPQALLAHDALHVLGRDGEPLPWNLVHGSVRWQGTPPARASANSPELLMRLALDGLGIAAVTDPFALPYLRRGELVQVLPQWTTPPVSAWAVFPGRRLMPAHTRAFVDALVEKFAGDECRVIEAEVRDAKARGRATARVNASRVAR
jgi:DNA-binding transcriptional LysR family regulator